MALAVSIAATALPFAPAVAQRAAADQNGPLQRAPAETVGISSARLAKLTKAFEKEIADKKIPGVVMMIARKGKLVYSSALGKRDPKAADPMRLDTIFRAYSMTKPMASVAAMILVEDGVIALNDPVSKWLPPFKDVKVSTPAGEVPPDRPMTVQDLLRHTAGLSYGELTVNAGVKDGLTKAGIFKPNVLEFDQRDISAAEFTERLAKVPLIHQPGTTWEYSHATDVLGRVVEAASGKRLGDFMADRIFKPLKMTDTAFWVPAAKLPRLAEPFEKDALAGTPIKLIDATKQPGNDSGGAGTMTTAGDYLRFAQMLANGGVLDGQRILGRNTVKLMTSDHLAGKIPLAATPGGGVLGSQTYGFGLGFAVRQGDGFAPFPGTAGDYNWGGYAGTYFWVDPKEQLTAVMMVQSAGALRLTHRMMFRQMVYQAVVD
jgi:CubicO group peptidase (beta-lactamase class C family)